MKRRSGWMAIPFLMLVLSGCGEQPDTDISNEVTKAESEVMHVTDTSIDTTNPLAYLTQITFPGEQMRVLDVNGNGPSGKYWDTYDIWAKDINGEIINDAVWRRNDWIVSNLGVTVTETKVSNVVDEITKSALAQNDEYDMLVSSIVQAGQLTTNRYLHVLNEMPGLRLEMPWWDQNALAGMSVGDKLYFACGDIVVIDDDATFGIMFSKKLADENGLALYDLVASGEWTYEKMYAMLEQVTADLNGDTAVTQDADRFGLSCGGPAVEVLFYSGGLSQTAKDSADLPVLKLDIDKTTDFIERAWQLCIDPSHTYNYTTAKAKVDSATNLLREERALFYLDVLQGVTRLRSSEADFGVIPAPKWDEAQEHYYSLMGTGGAVVSVPITNTRLEMTGAVMEAMAVKGAEYLTPAYYDVTLISRGLRDSESEPMIELILDSRVYDSGFIYGWAGLQKTIRVLVEGNRPNIASSMKALEKVFARECTATLEAMGIQ